MVPPVQGTGVVLLLVLPGGSVICPHCNTSLERIAAHRFDLLLCKNTCIPSLFLSVWVNFFSFTGISILSDMTYIESLKLNIFQS